MGALVVNNNIMAINTNRHLKINSRGLGTNLERLSSGLRINRAANDVGSASLRGIPGGDRGPYDRHP